MSNRRRGFASRPHKREGRHIPMTLWRCYCGRRFRGDARLEPHLERSGHGVAVNVRIVWRKEDR